MGVMSCDRKGCDHVMCDRYSADHGYICNDCFNELTQIGINQNVSIFMNSKKVEFNDNTDPYDYFDKIFPYPDGW